MLGLLRKLLLWFVLPLAAAAALFVGGYLQEFAGDELPEACREAGVLVPLDDPWIEVNIQNMTLTLMEGEQAVKRYSIGYGSGPVGQLGERADRDSTPLGEYRVIAKRERKDLFRRGSRFLQIDFPSAEDCWRAYEAGTLSKEDLEHALEALAVGDPPPADTPLGGPLGIQGNYFFFMDRRFTDGSIALSNGDINELYEHVPLGTPVHITRNGRPADRGR